MGALFLKLVNMSITASWLVLAIIAVRLIFKKAPKWILCLLWGLVAVRLICPFSIESSLSLIPDAEPLSQETSYSSETVKQAHGDILDSEGNVILERHPAANGDILDSEGNVIVKVRDGIRTYPEEEQAHGWTYILSRIWVVGFVVMFTYTAVSYYLLKKKVATAIPLKRGIKQSEYVDSPFVLGLIRPVIYLPFGMPEGDMAYVIAHEKAHIRRRDHWWKPFGFLLLSIYWFNPVLWVAYILLCRDIEAACDEKVIKDMKLDDRRAYSTALLNCSIHRRRIAACPLAFGEVGVKDRVKTIMNYKKQAFWYTVTVMILCMIVAVCFLTDPIQEKNAQSFLNHRNSILLSEQQDVIPAIHYSNVNDQGSIGFGMVEGKAFATYLDTVHWSEKWFDPTDLSSPGSVAVNVTENLRITIYDRKFAAVKFNDEVCYYRIGNSDYEKMLELLMPADEDRLEKSSETRLDVVLGIATIEENSDSISLSEKYTVGEAQVIGKTVAQDGYTMTIQEATHCENMIRIVADITFPTDREPILTHPTDVILRSGNEEIKCKSYSATDDSEINESHNVIRYDFRIKINHNDFDNNQFTLSISGFSDMTHKSSYALESPMEVSWEAKKFGDSRLFTYEDDSCKIEINISSIAVNVEVYQSESKYDSIEQILPSLKLYDKNGNVLPIRGSNGGSSSGRYMDFSVYLVDTLDINSIAKVQLGYITLK